MRRQCPERTQTQAEGLLYNGCKLLMLILPAAPNKKPGPRRPRHDYIREGY